MRHFLICLLLLGVPSISLAQINWGTYQDNNQTIYLYFNTVGTDGVAETLSSGTVEIYEDGSTTGRVMSICLHPFLIGHPYRAKYLDKALAHIRSRREVWLATGSEIIDAYRKVVA